MNLNEAKTILHVDNDYNDTLITALISATESYIELRTGLNSTEQAAESMCHAAQSMLLELWYYKNADDRTITRAIDDIISAIQIKNSVSE
jgi:hypothetical protein